MHLRHKLLTLTLFVTTSVPLILANPVEYSTSKAIEARQALSQPNMACVGPSQINLSQDPGMAGCGWKKWAACTALAAGVCLAPCWAGGLADPACDVCLTAMGALGCKECIENKPAQELWEWESLQLKAWQPKITAYIQGEYCLVPKPPAAINSLVSNAVTGTAQLPAWTAAAASGNAAPVSGSAAPPVETDTS